LISYYISLRHNQEDLNLPPEDVRSMDLRNVDVLLHHHTTSHPRRTRLESSPPCKPQISQIKPRFILSWWG
jgi:hypothetical protein